MKFLTKNMTTQELMSYHNSLLNEEFGIDLFPCVLGEGKGKCFTSKDKEIIVILNANPHLKASVFLKVTSSVSSSLRGGITDNETYYGYEIWDQNSKWFVNFGLLTYKKPKGQAFDINGFYNSRIDICSSMERWTEVFNRSRSVVDKLVFAKKIESL